MASSRRIGAPEAKNRAVLIDAAEQLLLEQGYAAVSSRSVARKAGLKHQLVHYYFRTMDELFLAVLRRLAEAGIERQAQALASKQPLRALWKFNREAASAALAMEFAALANHSDAIRAAIARYAEQLRRAQLDALPSLMQRYDVDPDVWPAGAIVLAMNSIPRVMALEDAIGVSSGHSETLAFIEHHLRRFEGAPEQADASARSTLQ